MKCFLLVALIGIPSLVVAEYVPVKIYSYPTLEEAAQACIASNGKYFPPGSYNGSFCPHDNAHYWYHNIPVDECPYSHPDFVCQYWFLYGQSCPDGTTLNVATNQCLDNDNDKNHGEGGCSGGSNPINLNIGNKYQIERDYISAGVSPLTIFRAYNSLAGTWRFFPEIRQELDGSVSVIRPDGRTYLFAENGSGNWSSDADVTGSLERFDDGAGTLTSWRYSTLDGQAEEYDANGAVLSIVGREGWTQTYTYSATEITVIHSNGDVLVYQLDAYDRISGFVTPDNDQYTYSYDTEGRLVSITYPDNGGSRVYHYENINFPNALTGITDANGNRFATWTYDSAGRASSSEHNNGADLVTLDYAYINDPSDPRVTATNALGKQTTYHFTTIHGVRKVTQIENHQSTNCAAANKAYTYDANGFLASKTDWKGNTTTYIRNAKGQELSRTEAVGTPEERTITTEWHTTFNLPTNITEPERETIITYDAIGNELSRVVSETTSN